MAARSDVEPRKLLDSGAAQHKILADAVLGSRRQPGAVRVLEAGCGNRWVLTPHSGDVHITGVDTDADALRIRREVQGDLDDEIHGDLRTVALPAESFDVVYCSYVLEHVAGAQAVLDRFVAALRPGGRLIVRVPDGNSVYGFLTKHSPHRVHVLYKRYVERYPNAGKPGYAPYPTVYDEVVTLRGLRAWAAHNGLAVLHEDGTNLYLKHFGRLRPVVSAVLVAIAACSRGRLSASHNNICMVFQKPGDGAENASVETNGPGSQSSE
ncbi:MAG: class I SAM-dependent methyltransferase [Pseudonocardiales bacterium]|nr:MAG: class I SAM-dependent methyltransferase [Pseudonocardiales bacterium]